MPKDNKKQVDEKEIEKAYKMWIGEKTEGEPENTPTEKDPGIENINTEENEPYQEIEPINVSINLPFEVSEGDLLDINAVVNKVNEDGSVEITIDKAFKK